MGPGQPLRACAMAPPPTPWLLGSISSSYRRSSATRPAPSRGTSTLRSSLTWPVQQLRPPQRSSHGQALVLADSLRTPRPSQRATSAVWQAENGRSDVLKLVGRVGLEPTTGGL
jgi:hypothetical protein